jgi:hypothetical protein
MPTHHNHCAEPLAGTELAVEGGAADLEQEIGASAGPSHLLGFVHAAIDQEVGGAFGERCADGQTGTMALSIVDQPSALAGQIAVDLAQRRRRDDGSLFRSPSPRKTGMTWRMRPRVTLASLPFQIRQRRRSTSARITALAFSRSGVSAGRLSAVVSAWRSRMAMWNQSRPGGSVTPALTRIERGLSIVWGSGDQSQARAGMSFERRAESGALIRH